MDHLENYRELLKAYNTVRNLREVARFRVDITTGKYSGSRGTLQISYYRFLDPYSSVYIDIVEKRKNKDSIKRQIKVKVHHLKLTTETEDIYTVVKGAIPDCYDITDRLIEIEDIVSVASSGREMRIGKVERITELGTIMVRLMRSGNRPQSDVTYGKNVMQVTSSSEQLMVIDDGIKSRLMTLRLADE